MKVILILTLLGLAAIVYRVVKGEGTFHLLVRRFGPSLCRVIGHRRSGGAVRKIEGIYHSRCRRCGVKLVKSHRDSEWHVEGMSFDDADDEYEDDTEEGHEHAHEAGSPTGAVLLLIGGVAVGALAIGFAMAPHHMQMREPPHKSYAELTRS